MRYLICACSLLGLLASMAFAQTAAPTRYQQAVAAYQAATELAKANKPAEALAAYQQVVKDFPTYESADSALIQVWILANLQKQHEVALAACDQLLKEYPKSITVTAALANKATSLRALSRFAEAAALNKQLAAIPGYSLAESALWGVIDCNMLAKNTDGLLAAIDAYLANEITEGARRPQALQQKLNILIANGDQAGIDATLAQIAKLPTDKYFLSNAYLTVAQGYDTKKDPIKAAEYYKLASESPASAFAQSYLLTAISRLTSAKQTAEAIALNREYLTRFPKGAGAVQCLGAIATLTRDVLKDRPQEIAVIEELLKACPNTYDATNWLIRLAQANMAQKNTDAALAAYKKISDQYPGTRAAADALFQQGEITWNQLKDKEGAKAFYQQVVANYDGTNAAEGAANRLARMQ